MQGFADILPRSDTEYRLSLGFPLQSEKGDIYKISFTTKYENQLVFLKTGDKLKISYIDAEGIKTIKELK